MQLICLPSHSWGHILKYGENVRHAHLLKHMLLDTDIKRILWASRVRPDRIKHNFLTRCGYERKIIVPLPGGILYRITKYQGRTVDHRYLLEHHLPHFADSLLASVLRQLVSKQKQNLRLWVGDPKESWINGCVAAKQSAFDAMDDWCFAPEFFDQYRQLEIGYKKAKEYDYIFANTETMLNRFAEHKNKILLPNAADKHQAEASLLKDLLSKYPRPWLGLVGKQNDSRLDYSLLDKILEQFKGTVFLAGEDKSECKNAGNKQNYVKLGWFEMERLHSFYLNLDALIVPRPISAYTLSQDSISVYEALSHGLPVVSTLVSPAVELDHVCYLAENLDDWMHVIDLALNEDKSARQQRISKMAEHSWAKRYQVFKEAFLT